MRKWLIGLGVAVLATAAALGVVRLTSTEGWATRQPGVERVHIVELQEVDQIEAHVDDAASARAFADELRARSGTEQYRAILTWMDGDVERSILVEPRTHEEAWRLAAAGLPEGVTSQRVGLHDGRIDAVEYTTEAIGAAMPISWFVSSLKLGPIAVQAPSAPVLNAALAKLDGFELSEAWTEETVVDIAARLAGAPGVKVIGQRVEITPGHTMGEDEATLRELARGTSTVRYGATFEADLSVDDCVRAATHLQSELLLEWRCGEVLVVNGPGEAVGREMAGLLAVVDVGASSVRRDIADDGGSLRIVVPDGAPSNEELVTAVRSIGWEGESMIDVRGEAFHSTATGGAERVHRDGGPVAEAWNATAEG
ncbi:MAG: hypothetical protein GX596_06565 [Propionibacterium sp.]|nr:hypothetical protein [Propionibacterium sp.]